MGLGDMVGQMGRGMVRSKVQAQWMELSCRKMNLTPVHYANTGVFVSDPKILQTDPEDQVCLGVP